MEQMLGYRSAGALWKASWEAGVMVVLVLAAQWAFGRRLHPRWRYSLWFLVMVRLALPWTVASPVSVFNLASLPGLFAHGRRPAAAAAIDRSSFSKPAGRVALERSGARPGLSGRSASGRLVLTALLGLWATGAVALTSFLLVTHLGLWRRVSRQRPSIGQDVLNLLEDCKQILGVRTPITLVETPEVGSPALFGFLRPRLLLPAGLTREFSFPELRYVFLHEVSHLKRQDILVGWVVTALQIVHWFNPLLWLGFRRMRLDRELACDALALSHLRDEENLGYGNTLIKLLERFGRSAWAPSLAGTVENRNQTRERIKMIATFKRTNRGAVLALAVFTALGVAALTDAQPAGSQLSQELAGTWVLVGEPGHIGAIPAEGGRLKSLTDTHWSVTQTDPKTGVVTFHHGGTYTMKGDEYDEHVEYANENTKELIGHTSRFKFKLDGDVLTLLGIGNPWKEVWKRAPASQPEKINAAAIQGTWTGQVQEEEGKGTASLVIRGDSLEFHAPDKQEWYKATFSLFDTTPKQLVATVTGSSVSDFVGQTAYAIYRLEDGTLTLAGNAPGVPVAPASFDAPWARKFVFTKK
jgi:uncharacterized protein (TIGR03067 family)